jgi:glycosyltransferase involved in cell wall biosynthesis
VGHLRAIKDPLVFARAAARLPPSSRIRVVQVGGVLEPALEGELQAELARNPRLTWRGPVPREEALRIVAAAHLLGIGSVLEGGANVVGEALALGTPPVATRIDGNVGLLGADWPALFEVGDVDGLARLLHRWETDPALHGALATATARLGPAFAPGREQAAWAALLDEVCQP